MTPLEHRLAQPGAFELMCCRGRGRLCLLFAQYFAGERVEMKFAHELRAAFGSGEKRVEFALRYIYGIGPKLALDVLKEAQIEVGVKAKDLTEEEVTRIAGVIDRNYTVEGQLRRTIQSNIARLKDIKCYRGMRHRAHLPVRGQRTRTNARTRKGPKKTVAGKKSVKAK